MFETDRAQGVASENAVLVRVILSDQSVGDDPLDELEGLTTTAGSIVVAGLIQRREKPDRTTYIGKGKVEELKLLVDTREADLVIFDNDLSPAQIRNLEQALCVKVLDRTELILDIFAANAQTHESRLAVELAQHEYALPRLKRMWTHLSRIKNGIGMRGPGEKQLEVDRRLVEKRIHDLRSELDRIERRKERQVSSRSDHMTVSLVGYTNAGKSTLMNSLTNAEVLAENKLFATLDTKTKRWHLPNWGPVLLSDTVGFIRDLPHRLIASFKATLEESRQADLLLHVADASNPAVFDQISAVYDVLEGLGIESKDTVLIVNKIDAVANPAAVDAVLNRYPNAIPVSARDRDGLDKLAVAVSDALSRSFHNVDIETSVSSGKLMAFLAAHGEIMSKRYTGERVTMHCRIPGKFLGKIKPAEATITPHAKPDAEQSNTEQSVTDQDDLEPNPDHDLETVQVDEISDLHEDDGPVDGPVEDVA